MGTLKKYSLEGKELGSVEVAPELAEAHANGQMVKDYIIALRANVRQWSANTKGRSEVSHSTQKPHPQKGTGRARQGSLAAPQYKGGGRVFGPKPKFDQHVKINRREKLSAIRSLIGEKIREERLVVVPELVLREPKTRHVVQFLKACRMDGARVLFIGKEEGNEGYQPFARSMRNIPRTSFALAKNINGYDLLLAHHIVITEEALQQWQGWLV